LTPNDLNCSTGKEKEIVGFGDSKTGKSLGFLSRARFAQQPTLIFCLEWVDVTELPPALLVALGSFGSSDLSNRENHAGWAENLKGLP